MKQLDLGCGSEPAFNNHAVDGYEHFGVDINPFKHVKQADLAIHKVPYESELFDLVTAYDFLEHIPQIIYLNKILRFSKYDCSVVYERRNCMVELFNEVYRVLKDGGEFYFEVPLAGSSGFMQDPTHLFGWTPNMLHYFSGDYFGFHDDMGHTSKFELLENNVSDERLHARLKAVKPCAPPYEVGAVT